MIDITHKDIVESESIVLDGIEFVKVVRCGECKWHEKGYGCELLNLFQVNMDNFYCADGERRCDE